MELLLLSATFEIWPSHASTRASAHEIIHLFATTNMNFTMSSSCAKNLPACNEICMSMIYLRLTSGCIRLISPGPGPRKLLHVYSRKRGTNVASWDCELNVTEAIQDSFIWAKDAMEYRALLEWSQDGNAISATHARHIRRYQRSGSGCGTLGGTNIFKEACLVLLTRILLNCHAEIACLLSE